MSNIISQASAPAVNDAQPGKIVSKTSGRAAGNRA